MRKAVKRYAAAMIPNPRNILPAALAACGAAALVLCATPASAEDREVPYWASIRVDEVNMRVGPAETYGIAWVYHRKHLPMKVVRLKEGWRLVRDPDGAQGWMLARFLSPERSAVVTAGEPADMREEASLSATLKWRLAPGVVGMLGDCDSGWCKLDVDGRKGFVPQDRLWGAGKP